MYCRHGPLALTPAHSGDAAGTSHDDLAVLLVNEPTDILDEVAALLRRRGLSVQVAGSVAEARQALLARGVGVLVADVGLLDGEGMALAAQVLAGQQPMANVELLLIAGYAGGARGPAGPLLDRLGLLQEPLRLRDIARAIDRSLVRAAVRRALATRRRGYDA